MRKLFVLPILLYRKLISPWLGPSCRFYPTCSAYAAEALTRHGIFKGGYLAFRRIIRCQPWTGSCGCDPVPERFAWRDVIRYTGATINSGKKYSKDKLL